MRCPAHVSHAMVVGPGDTPPLQPPSRGWEMCQTFSVHPESKPSPAQMQENHTLCPQNSLLLLLPQQRQAPVSQQSRTVFLHHVSCTVLPHLIPAPHSLYHAPTPRSCTALPHCAPTPRSYTALPHRTPAPRSCTTFLHHAPAPRSHTALLHYVLAVCSCTAFPHRTPLPDSHIALPHHVPAARSQTPFPHRILAPRSCHRAPTSCSCTPFPHRARSRTMFLHHAPAPDSCSTLPSCVPAYAYTAFLPPHSRAALPHSRHSPKTVPCCHPGPVPVCRGRAAAPRPRQEPSPPTTSSPAEDPEPVGRSPSPWGTWRGGTWGMPVEVQAFGSGRGC